MDDFVIEARARVMWQHPGSFVRRKWYGRTGLTRTHLVGLLGNRKPVVRVPLRDIEQAAVLDVLQMRASTYRPWRKKILRLDVRRPEGLMTLGVVLADPAAWLERIEAASSSSSPSSPPPP